MGDKLHFVVNGLLAKAFQLPTLLTSQQRATCPFSKPDMSHLSCVSTDFIPAPAYDAKVRSKPWVSVSSVTQSVTHALCKLTYQCIDYPKPHEDTQLIRLFLYDCRPAPCAAEYTVKHPFADSNVLCRGCLASCNTEAESTCLKKQISLL